LFTEGYLDNLLFLSQIRNAYKILVRKSEGKRLFGAIRRRLTYNMKWIFKRPDMSVASIILAQGRSPESMVVKLQIL
jgi:hypothetical protein